MSTKPTYIPGMCNIGPAEIKLRRVSGITGLVLTIAILILFVWLDVSAAWRLVIFLPVTLAAVGFLQAQLHFCVNFAMRGLFNVSGGLEKQESVDQKEYRRKDQQKAVIIIIASLAIGVIAAVAVYYLPI